MKTHSQFLTGRIKQIRRRIGADDPNHYPKWVIAACDRIAAKADNEGLTEEEAEALIIYLDGTDGLLEGLEDE